MKLCAIYTVWFDGIEILPFSIESIRAQVDEVIVIYSFTSNYGHTVDYMKELDALNVTLVNWEPNTGKRPVINETEKRNFGLKIARSFGYTHFLMMDCDECYDPLEFAKGKEMAANVWGLVSPVVVYLKEPTYQLKDHTLVPFIHELRPHLEFGSFRNYPFAYDGKHAHIDPTRRLNINARVEMCPVTMHHFSWVRKDINLKSANSTAKVNVLKSEIFEDYEKAKPGYYSKFYRGTIKEVDNKFGIKL
jgi:hypothetical protein